MTFFEFLSVFTRIQEMCYNEFELIKLFLGVVHGKGNKNTFWGKNLKFWNDDFIYEGGMFFFLSIFKILFSTFKNKEKELH